MERKGEKRGEKGGKRGEKGRTQNSVIFFD